jgi:hypothetical protein
LLVDLKDRGLLERTLVVVAEEFGRTPRINVSGANPGRQHWPTCFSAIIAGGGIRSGMVYGESDKTGAYVKDKPVRPQDLGATIYHALGVPLGLRLGNDGFTRPISSGEPFLDLFGQGSRRRIKAERRSLRPAWPLRFLRTSRAPISDYRVTQDARE